MDFNTTNFILGLSLLDKEKKRLAEKGVNLPDDWSLKQSLFYGAACNPLIVTTLVQNDVFQAERMADERLLSDNTRLLRENSGLQSSYARVVSEKMSLLLEMNNIKLDNSKLQGTLSSVIAENTGLNSVISESKAKFEAIITDLTTENTKLTTSFNSLKIDDEARKITITTLSSTNATLLITIRDLETRIKELEMGKTGGVTPIMEIREKAEVKKTILNKTRIPKKRDKKP